MFCIILKHHFWEPEVEVIQSDCIGYSITYIDVGIEATSLRPHCRYDDTTRYDTIEGLYGY